MMANRLDDPETKAFVLAERLASIRLPSQLDARLADAVELGHLSRVLGDERSEFFASYFAADAHLGVGDLAGFHADVENAKRLAATLAQPVLLPRALRIEEEVYWLRGDLDGAEALLDEMRQVAGDINQERQNMGAFLGSKSKIASAVATCSSRSMRSSNSLRSPREPRASKPDWRSRRSRRRAGPGVRHLREPDRQGGRDVVDRHHASAHTLLHGVAVCFVPRRRPSGPHRGSARAVRSPLGQRRRKQLRTGATVPRSVVRDQRAPRPRRGRVLRRCSTLPGDGGATARSVEPDRVGRLPERDG